ncbi:chemotaxis protein CheR [Aphanothece hegewaldii CCALA 016]|uniref:protein-glutamate O-methyltransferase n=1 Tax=Aphanothece hegewaldii CCALA 016 TaxID=2107694 RepID=A0A2T1LV40_9CHRO|nr:protein-glutamate O-methyltransferase CheR [Aphanothece hegewaldii]PSF35440.1 chemotaxis protein CheR [Aphanothece hegewaldii CCALA 016]
MDLPQANQELESLLNYLKNSRGCDLTGYKRSSLLRRFRFRMQQININSYQEYLKYLQNNSEEWLTLLNTVLINYTGFFRDRSSWDYLAKEIIPKIIASKQKNESIRVWVAGCASGEEVYSLVMLWAEALGIESCLERVQFYATDIDEEAIKEARQATYQSNPVRELSPDDDPTLDIVPHTELTGISPYLLNKYFQHHKDSYTFDPQLRRTIIFARHDLVKNAPISKIDLLVCRNVLIYFTPEYQATIFVRFHFALKDTGFLFLGKAESIINNRAIFTPISLKHRIYAKGLDLDLNDHLLINPKTHFKRSNERQDSKNFFWQTAFEINPLPQIAVNLHNYLIDANEAAHLLFGLKLDDLNRPFNQLELSKLVGEMKTFYENPHQVTLTDVEWHTATDTKYFDISIVPVYDKKKTLLGAILTFSDSVYKLHN